MKDEKRPAKQQAAADQAAPARERYPVIPLPQRRGGWRSEIPRSAQAPAGCLASLGTGLLWCMVIALATGAALRIFLHDRWIPLVWFNAFTLYVYLPVYLCLAIALGLRRWRLAVLAAGVAVCHLCWIAPDFIPRGMLAALTGDSRPAGIRTGGPASQVRVYFQNLNLHTEDFPQRIEAILEADADVIALVEFNAEWESVVRQSQIFAVYPHNTLRANPARSQQMAFFSKLPLEDVEHRFIAGRRLAIAATVHADQQSFRLFCLHAPRPLQDQVEQYERFAREAVAWVAETKDPCVVVGDLNATQHAAWYQRLAARCGLHSAHRDVGRGYAVTWPNGRNALPPIRIDHVLLSSHFICRRIREGLGGLSDHRSLICDLALASTLPEGEDEGQAEGE